jgi:hypothetical protein
MQRTVLSPAGRSPEPAPKPTSAFGGFKMFRAVSEPAEEEKKSEEK